MARSSMPCGRAPAATRALFSPPAARPTLLLDAGRVPFPGAQPRRGVVVRPQAPRGPLLLGPGPLAPSYADAQAARSRFPAAVLARYIAPASRPAIIEAPAAPQHPLTAFQREHITEWLTKLSGFATGFLPVRLDGHPDGRVRVVAVMTDVRDVDGPQDKPRPPVGAVYQKAVLPEQPPTYKDARGNWVHPWGFEHFPVPLDLDPQWYFVEDLRVAPYQAPAKPWPTYHTTLDQVLDSSGFKQSQKLREIRRDHWRYVAKLLRAQRPVAFEVLDDYPELAQFFAKNLAAAKSVAEILTERDIADNPDDPDITVHWSVQQGLLLYTRGKEAKIIAAIRAVRGRGAGFKWSGSLGAWYRPQSVGVSESTTDIDRVVRALREQGMVVAVERGETKSLGEANTRRQDHKFWRAEGYAGRAESAVEKSQEAEARAAQIRAEVPVGAATRKAERMEGRADRAEGEAAEHLEYVAHAAGAAQNLASTAAGYDTTVEITRKLAEKRADAFAQLFVRKVKGLTGAAALTSRKVDNLSEYALSWVVTYPPSANVSATVMFDGRAVRVSTRDGRLSQQSKVNVLREDVTRVTPEQVFAMVIAALPKYVADASALAPTDVKTFAMELSAYGRKRAVALAQAAGIPSLVMWPARMMYGRWRNAELHEGTQEWARGVWYFTPLDADWKPLYAEDGPPGNDLRFRLSRTYRKDQYIHAESDTTGTVDLDFNGMSIEEAWQLLLAGIRAVATKTPLVRPTPKKTRSGRAPAVAEGQGVVGMLPRDLDATPRARAEGINERLAPVTEVAAARLAELRAQAAGSAPSVALREQARDAGKSHGFYPTPPSLAEHVVALLDVAPGETALEPSAGMGALVGELLKRGARVTAVEFQPDRAAYLSHTYSSRGVNVGTGDFLAMGTDAPTVPEGGFNAVAMNPPFSVGTQKYTDAEHVRHALRFIAPGGRLVALMSPNSVNASSNAKRAALHAALAGWDVRWEPVDAKRFRISGTDTPTVILVARRPKANHGRGSRLARGFRR